MSNLHYEVTKYGAVVGISVISLYLMWRELVAAKLEVVRYRNMIEREKELRQVERKGRISMQQKKRAQIKRENIEKGFSFSPIGYVESPFPDRRGTPRQPNLVRAATGRIKFDKKIIQLEHFKELQEFSHVWIIWVFHENTNSDSSAIPAKIKPPRLHGVKVGCMSTRSPHRPNPIGLSVSEVIGIGPDYIDISCVDMVDGTPILDVKPYSPHDIVHSDLSLAMEAVDEDGRPLQPTPLRVPSWIYEADIPLREVRFSASSSRTLEDLESGGEFRHCVDSAQAKQLIRQVLRQDIRSASYRGKASNSDDTNTLVDGSSKNEETFNDANSHVYECRLDVFTVHFKTLEHYISVESIS